MSAYNEHRVEVLRPDGAVLAVVSLCLTRTFNFNGLRRWTGALSPLTEEDRQVLSEVSNEYVTLRFADGHTGKAFLNNNRYTPFAISGIGIPPV